MFLDDTEIDWEKRYSRIILKCFDSVLILYCQKCALNLIKKKKKKYSQISRDSMQFKSRNVCALMDKTFSFFPSVYWNTLSWGESHVGQRKERMVNLLFQETSNLLLGANVKSQKPVLRKRLGDSVLFLVSISPPSASSPSPALLILSSSPLSIPLLFWGGLLSTLKHPCAHRYYWGCTVHLNTPMRVDVCLSACVCVCVCVCVCASESLRRGARDTEWFSLTDRFCHTVL